MSGVLSDLDPEALADLVIGTIKGAIAPLEARLLALEKREPMHGRDGLPGVPGPPGKDGRDAVGTKELVDQVRAAFNPIETRLKALEERQPIHVLDGIASRVAALVPIPKDGASVTVDDVAPLIAAEVQKAVADIPLPKDGKDAEPIDLDALALRAADLVPLPKNGSDGKDGKSLTLADVAPFILSKIEDEIAAIPIPKDGKDGASVTPEDVAPLVRAEVAEAVKVIPTPKDGVGLTGALIDRGGYLVLTLSDGTTKTLGCVVGDVDPDDVVRAVNEQLATWAKPKDGRDGTLENLKMAYDGERTVTFCFKNGDPVEGGILRLPVPIYRGTFIDGKSYEAGDQVTWGGHMWHAKETTTIKPDETGAGARAWVLCVRRGRDGKPGPQGQKGDPGQRGEKGERGPDRW